MIMHECWGMCCRNGKKDCPITNVKAEHLKLQKNPHPVLQVGEIWSPNVMLKD